MGALLNNFSLVDHQDQVSTTDSTETVGNDKTGTTS
ncbi:MAG: hypothetical protein PWP42_475, partial [Candidatus Atribacteria bacterium]|nr:hypothetical protein [Candidatus Atribacteria bacterium]